MSLTFMLDSDMVVEIALGLTGEGALIAGVQGVRVSELQVVRQALVGRDIYFPLEEVKPCVQISLPLQEEKMEG